MDHDGVITSRGMNHIVDSIISVIDHRVKSVKENDNVTDDYIGGYTDLADYMTLYLNTMKERFNDVLITDEQFSEFIERLVENNKTRIHQEV